MTAHQHDSLWDVGQDRLNLYERGTDQLHGHIVVEHGEGRWECDRCNDRGGWFRDEAGAWAAFLDHEIRCPG